MSISLVANIAANLIAFLAFLSFFNASLSWLGSMVGHPEVSFEVSGIYFTHRRIPSSSHQILLLP